MLRAMPKLLPSYLRTGLDFDNLDTIPYDLLEDLPDDYHDPEQRAAKRRRIEAITNSYLKSGTRPLILSARLRGPFDKWDNPWGDKSRDKSTTTKNTNHARRQINGHFAQTKGLGTNTAGGKKALHQAGRDTEEVSALKLHTSEGKHNGQKMTSQQVEVPPVVAQPGSLGTEDHVVSTESFCASVQRAASADSPWLTHFSPGRLVGDVGTMSTPQQRTDSYDEEITVPPSVAWTKLPQLNTGHESSASAPMVISTRPQPVATLHSSNQGKCAQSRDPMNFKRLHPTNDTQSRHTMESTAIASIQHVAPSLPPIDPQNRGESLSTAVTLHLQEADPIIVAGYRSASRLARLAIEQASPRDDDPRTLLLSKDIPSSIVPQAQRTPTLLNAGPPKQRSSRKSLKKSINHDLVASPALASSTGFIYRKSERTKARDRAKPHLTTCSSTPTVTEDNHEVLGNGQPGLVFLENGSGDFVNHATLETPQVNRPDLYDITANGRTVAESHTGEEWQSSRRRSRLSSNFSTQTALMLAQMEFQEGTFPSVSSDTPHAVWHPQDNTPQPNRREPSPVITPFHAFNAELNRKYPAPEGILQGPPMSTQDLFAAASPFAFSTVKKRSERSQRSGLRFAVLSNEGEKHVDHENSARSPTPSTTRVPLKDRNAKVAFRETVVDGSEKGSQDSLLSNFAMSRRDNDVPLLDFPTCLDDIGSNGDLDFTHRFLRNLDALT